MCPILHFDLLGLHVHAYSFFAAVGACTGFVTAFPFLKREGLSLFRSLWLLICMAAAFLAGARLFNFIVNPEAYDKTLQLFSLRFAGFSLYGGVLGALAAFVIWTRASRRDPWPLLDALVLPTAAAFVLARVGCYLNGCCGGKATQSFLGVVFPVREAQGKFFALLSLAGKKSIAVFPTQLFELSLAVIILMPVMWFYLRKKLYPGVAFLLYGILFTAMRWSILPLRALPYEAPVTQIGFPLLYGTLIAAGGFLLLRRIMNKYYIEK